MMKEFFAASPALAWGLVGIMLALAVIALLWSKVVWWWHNTWYSFPLIGKINGLKSDANRDVTDPTWFKAEKTLCRDYKKFIRIQDEHDFNEKISYITKAGDNGRRETPSLIWVLTVALVFVEAMGFAYVLAGYTLPGASENMQQMGAYGIAFLISVILVAFTHFAGHELCKSGKIKHARQEWIETGRHGKISTGDVPLARDQSCDDNQPGYVQLMNRVGTQPSYYASIGTAVFVLIVAIGATHVRGKVLEKQLQQQTVVQKSEAGSTSLTKDTMDMSAKSTSQGVKLPVEDAAENRRADEKAIDDGISIDRQGGWGTFIVLAFIFIFLQILGVFFGFRWGFIGKDSTAAYRSIGAGLYSSYADVREHYKDIADTAQSKLEHLQQKMMFANGGSGTEGIHTTKTFYEFMDSERERETAERAKELQNAAQRRAMEKAPTPTQVQAAVVAAQVEVTAPVMTTSLETLDAALQKLQAMGDNKEAKSAYIKSMPDDLNGQVKQALKAQKETKEAAAQKASQRDAELDDLLS